MDIGNFLQSLGIGGGGAMPQPAIAPQAPPIAPQAVAQPAFGAAPQVNPLQALNMGTADAVPVQAPPPSAEPAGNPRRSLVDTLGRVADVFAKVGGADALYQPTLDAREDRSLALGDHARTVDLDKLKYALTGQKVEAGAGELGDAGNARLGQAVKGVQAILAGNPNADISKIFPILATQAGVPPERAAAVGAAIMENPSIMQGLAGTLGAGKEFGLQPFYAKDAQGNLQTYQLGKDGTVQKVALPDGVSAIDPQKFVDVGGAQVGVGSRSGTVTRILPKTEAPGRAADRAQRGEIAGAANASRERIAAMPARAKAGAAGATAGDPNGLRANAEAQITELEGIYDDLNKSGGISSTKRKAGANIMASGASSGIGQSIGRTLGTEDQAKRDRINSIRPALMQSLAKATGMSGKQLDSNADVKLFMQTVTDPSRSYEANKDAIAGLRRFLGENKAPVASSGGNRSAAPARTIKPVAKAGGRSAAPAAGKPSVSNW